MFTEKNQKSIRVFFVFTVVIGLLVSSMPASFAAGSVTSISLNKTSTSIFAGETETLICTVNSSDAADKTVFWSSNNPEAATVDSDGTVTAIAPGNAVITAASQDGNYTEACSVKVYKYREVYTNCFDNGLGTFSRVRGTYGTVSVSNGELVVDSRNEPDISVFIDNNSPSAADGMVSYTIRPTQGSPWPELRHGAVFRYTDTGSFAAIYFDNYYGSISYHNGNSGEALVASGVNFTENKTYKVDIIFKGKKITIKIDGAEKFSGIVDNIPASAGKIGFFGWSTGINYYDNISYKSEETAPPLIDFIERYSCYFDNGTGGFARAVGTTATASVINGELEVKSNNTNGELNLIVDDNSPSIADGRIEYTIRPTLQDPWPAIRHGVVFRYASSSSYTLLQFEPNGAVYWKTASSAGTLISSGITFESGKTYKIEVTYEGTNVILKINAVEKFNGNVSGITTGAGKIGFESWASGTNYYDNISYMDETTKPYTLNYTWAFGNDVDLTTPQRPYWLYCDGDAGVARDAQNNLWFLHGDSARWIVAKGTNMDNLQDQYEGVRDSSFDKPNGDDEYWACGLWTDSDGKWYTTVHIESNYEDPWPYGGWTRRIGLATSTDQGRNWHYEGDIITSSNYGKTRQEIADHSWDAGCGDQILYVDTRSGYFYLYYHRGWGNALRVARAPISGKMAPGTWSKWYNGAWKEPGLYGHDSDIYSRANGMVVFYSTYFNKYVGIFKNVSDMCEMITTCTDLGRQNWETPVRFADISRVGWYNFACDANGNRDNLGQTFRFYSQPESRKYMEVSFKGGKTTSGTRNSTYPIESVMDANPGYGYPLNSTVQDFNTDTGGWTKVSGNGTWVGNNSAYSGTSSDTDATIAVDNNAAAIADGFCSFLVNPVSGQQFGGVIRYVSDTNYSVIKYDNGIFTWQNGSGQSGTLFTMTPFTQNSTHRIDIDYSGASIRIKVDGFVKFDGTVSGLTTDSGKPGLMVWGGASTSFDCFAQSSTVASRKVKTVVVKDAPVTWTTYASLTMKVNESKQLFTDVYPYDATNRNINLSSTNTAIITVDSQFNITAAGVGTAYVAIDSADGACKIKFKVTVIN